MVCRSLPGIRTNAMRRPLDFISPWALAGIAVWMVIVVVAYNWAIPIYANIGGPGLCPAESPDCSPATFTVTQPDTAVFAIVVASILTAFLAAAALVARRFLAGKPETEGL